MIRVQDLHKSYLTVGFSKYHALRGLSIELPPKLHVGIVGSNGAGKSTFLRILAGVEVPDSGSISIAGSVSPPFGLGTALATSITGRDNATFVSRVNGDDKATQRERVAFINAFSELGQFFDRPVNTYSSGMRARLAFSISMAFDYDYYLVDELTAVGDVLFREKAERSFREKRGRASVLLVSHNLQQLRRDCEAGVYMRDGKAEFYESVDRAIAAYNADQRKASS